jgi:hypothetical protein
MNIRHSRPGQCPAVHAVLEERTMPALGGDGGRDGGVDAIDPAFMPMMAGRFPAGR